MKSGGLENHTWLTEERVARAGGGGGAGGAIFGAGGESGRCERTLMFRDGRVVDEDWSGEPEFCKRFGRPR